MATDRDEDLRNRAYRIWESEGRPDGMEAEHWARAERELAAEAAGGSPAEAAPASPAGRSRKKRAATAEEPAGPVAAAGPMRKKRASATAAKPRTTPKKKD
jgi:hypothetical protein